MDDEEPSDEIVAMLLHIAFIGLIIQIILLLAICTIPRVGSTTYKQKREIGIEKVNE